MLPGYRRLLASGELPIRLSALRGLLSPCRLCHHRCGVDRLAGDKGLCGAGAGLEVASSCVHYGEEPVLGGSRGVGNIFLGRCSLRCVFCQNWAISQPGPASREEWGMTEERLAEILMGFQQAEGCPTAGFVTPTHFAPQLFGALALAAEKGFSLPVIYNTGGYDTPELLDLLDGLVDIYLPDFKYWEEGPSVEYSSAPGYPDTARAALREMYRQVGDLEINGDGVAVRGLIVRLLVLPNGLAGTEEVLRFIAGDLGTGVAISLMSQYSPRHLALEHPLLSRRLRPTEYWKAVEVLEELGFENGWTQDPVTSPDHYLPDSFLGT
jgi:putative pyruvate formate lyase activating enzyme